MRTAVLPTGESLQFDDTTPDHVMHKAVRERMGLPPPVPTSEELVGNALTGMQQAHAQHTDAMTALMLRMGVMIEAFQRTAREMTAAADRVTAAAQQIHDVSAVAERIVAAVGHASHATQSAADVARSAGESVHANTCEMEKLVAHFAKKVDNSTDKIVTAFKSPKRAVKGADGNWRTENVEN